MRIRIGNRKFHLSVSKHKFYRASQEAEHKKRSILHLGGKAKYVLVAAIIVVMIVSIFAALQNQSPSTPTNIPQSSDDPTVAPSPTNSQTPSATKAPTTQPNTNPQGPRMPAPEPTFPPRPPGIIERAQVMNSSVWKVVATQAWSYFQPDVGVDRTMGLPGSVSGYPYFTDWDLGVYIQAVLDAQKIGLITKAGEWGADYRFAKVLKFLDTRSLNETTHYPFWFYQAGNGDNYEPQSNNSKNRVDTVDTGRLFVALNNLKGYTPSSSWSAISNSSKSITRRINDIVLNGRSNYAALIPDIKNEAGSNSIYAYYYISGFAAFWPNELGNVPPKILQNLLSSPLVTVNTGGNISLPNSPITCEPLLDAVFGLNLNSTERAKLVNFTRQVYLAHEERYNLNMNPLYAAFSEGNSGTQTFIYEWVILPGVGSWKVTKIDCTPYEPFNPIIYSKVALSFLALYNTSYAKGMSVYLEKALPVADVIGWADGTDYTVSMDERNIITSVGSNTNGMILQAATYAVNL